MTRKQAELLIQAWANYQHGNPEARIGPEEITSPNGEAKDHAPTCLGEFLFVQKQIVAHCPKGFDQTMLSAILVSWYYHGRKLKSALISECWQHIIVNQFLTTFETLEFREDKKLVEVP